MALGLALAACGGQAPAPTAAPAATSPATAQAPATQPPATTPAATAPVAAYPATVEAQLPYPAGTEAPAQGGNAPAPVETVIAPSGQALLRCGYVAQATGTEAYEWSCGATALMGDITPGEEGWEIARGTVPAGGGAPVADAGTALVLGMALEDGAECFSAGTGATAGFQDQRLNYTCGERAADGTFTALFGELTRGEDGFHVLRATGKITPDGFQSTVSDTPAVAALYVES